jgi:hypothetical protein
MKNDKIAAVICALFLAYSSPALADGNRPPPPQNNFAITGGNLAQNSQLAGQLPQGPLQMCKYYLDKLAMACMGGNSDGNDGGVTDAIGAVPLPF